MKNNYSTNDLDLIALARRFDINRNGRISLRELKIIFQSTLTNSVNSLNNAGIGTSIDFGRASRQDIFRSTNFSVASPKSKVNDKINVNSSYASTRPTFYSPSRSLTFLKHYQHLYPK